MSARILVVDDEPAIADAVSYALRSAGFDVDALGDGEAALEAARAERYDVLVLDVRLPGLSGVEVCRAVKANPFTARVPVLMLTAAAEDEERRRALAAGADGYVTKPFSPLALLNLLDAHLSAA